MIQSFYKKLCVLSLGVLISAAGAQAQTSVSSTTAVTQNFDAIGTSTTLPANWKMHASTSSPTWTGAASTVTQAATAGSPSAGGTYNLGPTSTDRAIGAMTSGSFASPNNLLGYFRNTNAQAITQLTIAYDAKRFRINSAAASVQFFYSLDGSSWTPVSAGDIAASSFPIGSSTYTFTSPNAPLVINMTNIVISGLNITNASDFYLRWNINTTGGNSQAIAIDNISVTAAFASACSSPATQASTVAASAPTATSFTATWASGSGDGTLIVVKPTAQTTAAPVSGTAYTGNANYTLADQINTNNRVVYRGNANTVTVTNLTAATQYTATAYEYNATGNCYNTSAPLSASIYTLSNAPAAQPAAFTSPSASPTTVSLSFSAASTITNAAGYIILQKSGLTPPTGTPANAAAYTAGATIGDATVAAVITSGSATSATISNLSLTSPYSFVLVPYNWDGTNAATYNYLTAGALSVSQTTLSLNAPTITTPTAATITSNSAVLGGNVVSDGGSAVTARGVVLSLTAINNDPLQGGTGVTNLMATGTTGIFTVPATALTAASQYSYKAYATNTVGQSYTTAGTFYTLISAPTAPATALVFSNPTTTSLSLSWTSGTGTSRVVVARPSATAAVAPAGGSLYTSNSADITDVLNGTTGAGNVVVYNGTGSSVTVTGLTPGASYAFDIYEYNGGANVANYSAALSGTRSSLALEPATAASNVTFTNITGGSFTVNWISGTGANRIVLVKAASAVDADPADGTTYTSSSTFTSGAQIGTGNYVVYKSAGSSVTVTGLSNGTSYYVAVYEYNGSGSAENYLTTAPATGSQLVSTPTYYSQGSLDATALASWNTLPGGGGTAPAAFNGGNFIIQTGHTMTTSNSWAVGTTGTKLEIMTGATLNATNAVTLASTATFQLDSAALYIHDNSLSPATTVFAGAESLHAASTVEIRDYSNGNTLGNVVFGNLTINNTVDAGASWQLSGSLTTVNGNLVIQSMATSNSRELRFTASTAFTLNIGGNLVINGGIVDIASSTGSSVNRTINIGGSFIQTGGTFKCTGNSNPATINFTGTGSFNQGGGTFTNTNMNWVIAPAANITLGSNLPLASSRSLTVNGTLNTGTNAVTGAGSFTLAAGGTLGIGSPDGITTGTAGNIQVTGARNFNSTATYNYNGAGAQTSGNALPASIDILLVNAASGVTLNQATTVNNQLTLTAGKLVLGSNNLTIGNTATVAGGSTAAYVQTNGTGVVRRNVPGTGTATAFPVGNSAYNPVTLSNSGAATVFSVALADDVLTNGTAGSTITNPVVKRTWNVTPDAAGAVVNMTLQWNSLEDINSFDYNHVYIAHFNGSVWENYTNHSPSTAPAAAGTNPYTVTQANITSFSPFTVGSAGVSPLAIHLTDITAANKGNLNIVSWNTAAEGQNDRFELERSEDGNHFTRLAGIAAKGSNSHYDFTDNTPLSGNNYYRLKLVDAGGSISYSAIVVATVRSTNGSITVYPNPVADYLFVESALPARLCISDQSGRTLQLQDLEAGRSRIVTSGLMPGVYYITVASAAGTSNFKIVK